MRCSRLAEVSLRRVRSTPNIAMKPSSTVVFSPARPGAGSAGVLPVDVFGLGTWSKKRNGS